MLRIDDDLEALDGLSIHIRAALGGEQLFQLTGNVLTFESKGPIYEWASGQVQLSHPQVETIFALLQKVRIGPVLMSAVGLDGETTIVTIREGQNRVELEYWDAPKPWKPIEKLVEIVRDLIEKAIAEDRGG